MNLDAVNFDALYLVKLIFGKYFCYFDLNRVADLLQLHLQLDAIRIPVRERELMKRSVIVSANNCKHIMSTKLY